MNKLSNLLLFMFCLLFSVGLFSQNNYAVYFEGHTEFFDKNIKEAALEKPSQEELVNDYYIRYVQFENLPNAKKRAKLEQEGLQFLSYITYGAYLTAIPKDFDLTTLENEAVRSIVPVNTNWKINANLIEKPYGDWAVDGDNVEVLIQVYKVADLNKAVYALQDAGYEILFVGRQGHWIKTKLPQTKITETAALPFVANIELTPPPGSPEDIRGRALHRSNMINSASPMGKKYDGTGITVLVRDDGMVGPHIDFHGRQFDLAEDDSDVEHADGVAGIMAGAGNAEPDRAGMASGSDMYVIDYVNHFEDNTLDLHQINDVRVTNSSYSDGCNGGYTLATRTVERQIYQNPTLMHVFSAGNSGTLNCQYGAGNVWGNITGGHKQAKNCLTTANLRQNFILENSSSRGPAHDGRIKPDISANGYGHFSTEPNHIYSEFGGTSAAAPGIAGITAQLMHAYHDLTGDDAPSALIKAAILNGANDMGNIGPDYKYGWGHINAHRALMILENENYWTNSVDDSEVFEQTITVGANQTEAKFMLYWAEMEASSQASRALINDLDVLVVTPSGDTLMPWLLDPTPNPSTLDAPATNGRDNLNNIEQVTVFSPEAGDYKVIVHGYQVPMGPQEFYIVHETRNPKPTITFPNGGEGFSYPASVRIHWDAEHSTENATLEYTFNDGATWSNIATIPASDRYYDWSTPNQNIGNGLIRITIGSESDTTDYSFDIVRKPNVLIVDKVCPDTMHLRVIPVPDTIAYDIYLLGEKYMELKGYSEDAKPKVAIDNPADEIWVAVTPVTPSGARGARIRAVRHQGGLRNCPQQNDAEATSILEPMQTRFSACDAITQNIQVGISNVGANIMTGATISYQVGNQSIVTENLADLGVGDFIMHAFQTPAVMDTNATLQFRAWVNTTGDVHGANDTIRADWLVTTRPIDMPFEEDFQALDNSFPPFGWSVVNPDDRTAWTQTNVLGIDNQSTISALMDFYNYQSAGERDVLFMPAVDLSNFADPALKFDLAYKAQLIPNRKDVLRIEAFSNCDLTTEPIVLYEKTHSNLASTSGLTPTQWQPTVGSDWRTDLVSLKQFNGPVILRFVGITAAGNSLFIDNVNLTNAMIAETNANFTIDTDTICKGETITVSDLSTGEDITYNWSFGSGASPSTAIGAGPFEVAYNNAFGDRKIQLVLVGAGGIDTLSYDVFIFNEPNANFSASNVNTDVTFTNTSSYGETYLWEFGDGTTSTEISPTHTYVMDGQYTVTLTTTNRCGESVETKDIDVMTVGTNTLPDSYSISASPNPTKGAFRVFFQSPNSEALTIQLNDITGRLLEEKNVDVSANIEFSTEMGSTNLPNGVYSLVLRTEAGEKVFQVVVQQ